MHTIVGHQDGVIIFCGKGDVGSSKIRDDFFTISNVKPLCREKRNVIGMGSEKKYKHEADKQCAEYGNKDNFFSIV